METNIGIKGAKLICLCIISLGHLLLCRENMAPIFVDQEKFFAVNAT